MYTARIHTRKNTFIRVNLNIGFFCRRECTFGESALFGGKKMSRFVKICQNPTHRVLLAESVSGGLGLWNGLGEFVSVRVKMFKLVFLVIWHSHRKRLAEYSHRCLFSTQYLPKFVSISPKRGIYVYFGWIPVINYHCTWDFPKTTILQGSFPGCLNWLQEFHRQF